MANNAMQKNGKAMERDVAARRSALSLLAEAGTAELATLLESLAPLPDYKCLKGPEVGLVMVRGRICGDGQPFNIGEATVSRAAVQLASSEIGFGYVLGRDGEKARLVALCDALLGTESHGPAVEQAVLAPLQSRVDAQRRQTAERTAATRVDFFTLVRGED